MYLLLFTVPWDPSCFSSACLHPVLIYRLGPAPADYFHQGASPLRKSVSVLMQVRGYNQLSDDTNITTGQGNIPCAEGDAPSFVDIGVRQGQGLQQAKWMSSACGSQSSSRSTEALQICSLARRPPLYTRICPLTRGAGPRMTLPWASYWEPWQLHLNLFSD